MARCALKRSLRPASCCSVEVMNGAAGERRKGRSVTALTVKERPTRAAATDVASSSPSTRTSLLPVRSPCSSKSLPVAMVAPPSPTSAAPKPDAAAAFVKVPSTPHQVAERKRMRARSRSTTIRVATLCTRPAERRGMTLRHRTGDTS